MSKCKACGAEIRWITMPTGWKRPVDKKKVPYREDPDGDLTVITDDCQVVKGVLDLDSDKYGYRTHMETCSFR